MPQNKQKQKRGPKPKVSVSEKEVQTNEDLIQTVHLAGQLQELSTSTTDQNEEGRPSIVEMRIRQKLLMKHLEKLSLDNHKMKKTIDNFQNVPNIIRMMKRQYQEPLKNIKDDLKSIELELNCQTAKNVEHVRKHNDIVANELSTLHKKVVKLKAERRQYREHFEQLMPLIEEKERLIACERKMRFNAIEEMNDAQEKLNDKLFLAANQKCNSCQAKERAQSELVEENVRLQQEISDLKSQLLAKNSEIDGEKTINSQLAAATKKAQQLMKEAQYSRKSVEHALKQCQEQKVQFEKQNQWYRAELRKLKVAGEDAVGVSSPRPNAPATVNTLTPPDDNDVAAGPEKIASPGLGIEEGKQQQHKTPGLPNPSVAPAQSKQKRPSTVLLGNTGLGTPPAPADQQRPFAKQPRVENSEQREPNRTKEEGKRGGEGPDKGEEIEILDVKTPNPPPRKITPPAIGNKLLGAQGGNPIPVDVFKRHPVTTVPPRQGVAVFEGAVAPSRPPSRPLAPPPTPPALRVMRPVLAPTPPVMRSQPPPPIFRKCGGATLDDFCNDAAQSSSTSWNRGATFAGSAPIERSWRTLRGPTLAPESYFDRASPHPEMDVQFLREREREEELRRAQAERERTRMQMFHQQQRQSREGTGALPQMYERQQNFFLPALQSPIPRPPERPFISADRQPPPRPFYEQNHLIAGSASRPPCPWHQGGPNMVRPPIPPNLGGNNNALRPPTFFPNI